ncbi:hypothetical protein [Spirosoma foliorum]|uniref:Uncharacterized protein n=1 Tax=Spirosoma foliorum TaxID=2710596 RepID=A0A7G5H5K5_9BACT|nr:hypothetical protein [Spirosoma foliorum]QMW06397.1 hypothetical protein H3H32_16640 [Spirosoma foliorum]
MKAYDPDQLNLFYDFRPLVPAFDKPVESYTRVQDKLEAAAAKNQSLIRLQISYGGGESIIKIQTKGDGATGWRYLRKFNDVKEAKDTYAEMLKSGDYAEG